MSHPNTAGITAAVLTGDFMLTTATLTSGALLADLYRLIGCDTVDLVPLDEGLDMCLDDEGLYNNVTPNPAATMVAHLYGFTRQPYYGAVVFTGGIAEDGNALPPLRPNDAAARRTHRPGSADAGLTPARAAESPRPARAHLAVPKATPHRHRRMTR